MGIKVENENGEELFKITDNNKVLPTKKGEELEKEKEEEKQDEEQGND
jgi:hypothetical protein